MSQPAPRRRGRCPHCGGRAVVTKANTIGAHRVVGLAGHGGPCPGAGQPPMFSYEPTTRAHPEGGTP